MNLKQGTVLAFIFAETEQINSECEILFSPL